MARMRVTAGEVVALLNEATGLDHAAMKELIAFRVVCDSRLAGHPTIQVVGEPLERPRVGMLGILNGLFGTKSNGAGVIVMAEDDETGGIKFVLDPDDGPAALSFEGPGSPQDLRIACEDGGQVIFDALASPKIWTAVVLQAVASLARNNPDLFEQVCSAVNELLIEKMQRPSKGWRS